MIMVGIQAALGQVLDTISRTTYDRYYYDWWPNSNLPVSGTDSHGWEWWFHLAQNSNFLGVSVIYNPGNVNGNNIEIVQLAHTDSVLKVVGLAACAYDLTFDTCNTTDNDVDHLFDYLRLYGVRDGNVDSLYLINEGIFSVYHDTAHLFELNDDFSSVRGTLNYLPVYEVYFNKPELVNGFFWIGGTNQGIATDEYNRYHGRCTGYYSVYNEGHGYSEGPVPLIRHKVMNEYSIGHWTDFIDPNYETNHLSYLIWPILEEDPLVEFHCYKVEGVAGTGEDTCVDLSWVGLPCHSMWQVCYSAGADDTVGGTIVDCNANYLHLCLPDTGLYFLRVRGYCPRDSSWGGWSDSIAYRSTLGGETEGIGRPSVVEAQTRVFPNPAVGEVHVASGYRIQSLELYSLTGQKIAERQVDGHNATMRLDGIPSGQYMLVVRTSQGSVARKLVVAE